MFRQYQLGSLVLRFFKYLFLFIFSICTLVFVASLILCQQGNGWQSLANASSQPIELVGGNYCRDGECQRALLLEGPIRTDASSVLNRELERQRKAGGLIGLKWLCLNSPGGRIVAAMDIASWVEANDLNTCITNVRNVSKSETYSVCGSACTYIFIAGKRRVIDSGSALIIHRSFIGLGKYCGPCNFAAAWVDRGIGHAFARSLSPQYAHLYEALENTAMKYPEGNDSTPSDGHKVQVEEFGNLKIGDMDDYDQNGVFVSDEANMHRKAQMAPTSPVSR